ncbi:DUF6933 domain-containing protein [Paenibacillus sp. CN-4]|uniref:DUF6933 domain-containing protein n=1 Tax=Paenibacillus nanchangensis TaxID=3348343 RepID=UPI003978F9E4
MLVFKATKDTLKDLKVLPDPVGDIDLFYCWHVNLFQLYRKKQYVFMNDLTRLSLTVSGIRSGQKHKVKDLFVNSLKEYLNQEDLPTDQIHEYLENCKESVMTKTDNRSVISTLSEIMLIMKSLERDNKGFEESSVRHKWNNRIIYKPIDYQKPIDFFRKELEQRHR